MLNLAPGKQFFAIHGEVVKLDPWAMEDEKTKENKTGFSGQVRVWGATVKFGCDQVAYNAIKPYVGRMVQLEGEASHDSKTNSVKLVRVSRASVDGQQIYGQAESSPAGAADPATAAAARSAFGGRKAA